MSQRVIPLFLALAAATAAQADEPVGDQQGVGLMQKYGSSGAWGPLPMPPVSVSEEDLKPLVDWILSPTSG